ncbi:hypothetical protein FQN54_003740 [Arachnomyces sp. PD_36]|nr:hypothetical protein FQN54_003740 [Arachnomyces sp. PD_36]
MSFLSNFCGCFAAPRPKSSPRSPHRLSCPYEYPGPGNGYPPHGASNGSGNANDDWERASVYSPTMPLPRYTPHPSIMNEKTLAFERPARSSWTSLSESRDRNGHISPDEKHPYEFRREEEGGDNTPQPHHQHQRSNSNTGATDDISSDASSTLSYPSSYGNTSTATTSPPPPYSPHPSPPPQSQQHTGSIMSMSMAYTGSSRYSQDNNGNQQPPSPTSPVIHIPQPQPVLQRAQFLQHHHHRQGDEGRRRSGEDGGRGSVSSLPPLYMGRGGGGGM